MNKKMIEMLQKRQTELNGQIERVNNALIESDDKEERAKLSETLSKLRDELNEVDEVLKSIDEESPLEDEDQPLPEGRSMLIGSYQKRDNKEKNVDPYDTVEYRTAFMNYVCRNTPIPAELRVNASTTTTDASAVIPTTILNEIIRELKVRGNIWNKVRKLNIQGGVEVPILSLIPTASWIGENKEAESQKLDANSTVSFKYYGLECKLSQSILVNVTTLDMFQQQFVELATEAIIAALEKGVFNGSGTGQMTGITKDARVTKVVELTAADIVKWDIWKKNVFAKIGKAYKNGEFFMAESTFQSYVDGMVDANGQPVARVNYGIAEDPVYRFGGKNVETVEEDIIESFDTAETGAVIAVFGDLRNYAINSNMQMRVDKWEDHDTHEIKNNCLMICDGKVLDPNGFILIKKKVTA